MRAWRSGSVLLSILLLVSLITPMPGTTLIYYVKVTNLVG